MALAYSLTTSGTTLAKVHKKIQGNLLKVFQTKCEEISLIKSLKEFDLNFSAREVTTPCDVTPQGSGAFIAEAAYEANPKTAAPQELTFTWANYNDRFSLSLTSKYIDQKSRQSQVIRQLKYQTLKMGEGMANRIGWSFYGVSTGYMCQTSTNATSTTQTLTLINAFGQSDIDSAAYLSQMFAVGDRIAGIRSSALVANSLHAITAVTPATPAVVTAGGSWDSDANDYLVFANSIQDTDIDGTEYNLAPVGLIDMCVSDSVHGLATSTYAKWGVTADTTGGRYSAVRLLKDKHAIKNKGGGDLDLLIVSQGVLRDMYAQERSALRYADPFGLEFDGAVKAKGVKIHSSRKSPPSRAFAMDSSSLHRWSLKEWPGDEGPSVPEYSDEGFDKIQDRNALVYSFDMPYQFIVTNRANIVYSTALTES